MAEHERISVMRRPLTLAVVLSLVLAGLWPLVVPTTASGHDHTQATVVASGRVTGAITVVSTKRSPIAHGNLALFANVEPVRASGLTWTSELVVTGPPSLFLQAEGRAISPRAPPTLLTSSAA